VAIGSELLRFLSVSGFFITVALTFNGGLQGTGDTRSPLVITLISQVALPLGVCYILQTSGNLTPPGVWTAIVIGHFTRCVLTVARFKQGKWKQIRVE
jgi:Na+-driven multidrug efflux pump